MALTKRELKTLSLSNACKVLMNNDLGEKYKNQLEIITNVIYTFAGAPILVELEERGYFTHRGELHTLMYNGSKDCIQLVSVCSVNDCALYIKRFGEASKTLE